MPLHTLLITLALIASTALAREQRILPGTSSSNKIAVLEEITRDGPNYYFVRQRTGEKLGYVLPARQRDQINNVHLVASWNRPGDKVALLVFYGTKMSELLLFTRAENGKFHPVEFHQPDARAFYHRRTGKTIAHPGDGYSNDAVGPWLDDDTVALVSGDAIQTRDINAYIHIFATFEAHLHGTRAELSAIKLLGPMSDARAKKFTEKWGAKYFN